MLNFRINKQKDIFEPAFTSIEHTVTYPEIKLSGCCSILQKVNKLVALANYSHDENKAQFIIQWERQTEEKEKATNAFNLRERYYLKIYSTFVAQKLRSMVTEYYSQRSLTRSIGILETFQEITHEKNYANIFVAVRDFMPAVFRAQKAGFFFMDQLDPKLMYTITSVGEDKELNIKYIKSVAKYPVGFGYTGKWIELKTPLVYYDKEASFSKG